MYMYDYVCIHTTVYTCTCAYASTNDCLSINKYQAYHMHNVIERDIVLCACILLYYTVFMVVISRCCIISYCIIVYCITLHYMKSYCVMF